MNENAKRLECCLMRLAELRREGCDTLELTRAFQSVGAAAMDLSEEERRLVQETAGKNWP